MKESINIIENITNAISILNQTEKYINELDDKLSDLDKLSSDYEHLIENEDVETIDLKKLFCQMKEVYVKRRKIKQDKALGIYFTQNSGKLNNTLSREFLVQGIKTTNSKLNTEYKNRILTDDESKDLKKVKKVGRPKKVQECS